ncbi:MAG: lysophospholipid acyltransferase family protein [Nitrospirota bacterium]|nr:lysophospholipid acyltransferase family protein [Nitrospirota bacterium]
MKKWLSENVVPPIGYWLIRVLGWTMHWSVQGSDRVDQLYGEGKRVIIAFWHDQQLMMPLAYRGSSAHILISQHRDGELIRRIVKGFGFGTVRGSTTRGGSTALLQLIRLGQTGEDLVVTPDGPKGPRHVVQKGVVYLAQATGLPIIPLSFACSKKKSSRAGINLFYHFPSLEDALCGANLFGLSKRMMI